MEKQPGARVIYRDVGQHPPAPVTGEWIHAAFTPEAERAPWMRAALAWPLAFASLLAIRPWVLKLVARTTQE